MDEEMRQKIALFRFSIIAPLVNDTYEARSKEAFYRFLSSKSYIFPDGKETKFSPETIKNWFLKYSQKGMDGLMPKTRNDAGSSRVLTNQVIGYIHELKDKYPYITGTLIHQKLIEQGYIKASKVSLATILRYIKANGLRKREAETKDRRAFEMEHANDCWQADTTGGPVIKIDKRKKATYLVSFIDDASRLITHAEFFYNDNGVNIQQAFKKAVYKYGVPKRLYVDNGSSYKNNQLSMICASLGVTLIHTPPYSPENKGKIERVFRSLKDAWINVTDWNSINGLEELNTMFTKYINEDYNNHYHRIIEKTPKERWFIDSEKIKYMAEDSIDKCFLHRIDRKVAKDATIRINNEQFEVPPVYIGQKINVRYMPGEMSEVYIFNVQGNLLHTIYPLRRVDNSKIKRNKNLPDLVIDYSLISGGEDDV